MNAHAGRLVTVVEDEETIREAVCFALRRDGYRAEGFDDGLLAWEAFERALPDLAILDIGVPRLDGLELCRRLRARSETLPIIFVTSREEEFDRVLGLELGADDYLCKPFSMRELMARVKVLLRRASLVQGAARAAEDQTHAVGDLLLDPLRLVAAPDVIVTLDPRSCYVRGSADRLAQAFENVVSNARSFAPRGTVIDAILTASTGRCDIVVADRGPGIPAAHLDRIFERFFSYRPGSSAERGSHAGLGLAIARTIVQGYGGTIGAANRPEGGAAFEIKLPLD